MVFKIKIGLSIERTKESILPSVKEVMIGTMITIQQEDMDHQVTMIQDIIAMIERQKIQIAIVTYKVQLAIDMINREEIDTSTMTNTALIEEIWNIDT